MNKTKQENTARICSLTYEEYKKKVEDFHGSTAPGMIIGGFMVDLGVSQIQPDTLFDVICESSKCLPDSVQLLTPCTIGNGWLKIIDTGRYAIVFYDKYSGEGIRIFLDSEKIEQWAEIKSWFYKLKPKKDQDTELLLNEICKAGTNLYSVQTVQVDPNLSKKNHDDKNVICPVCHESYPLSHGNKCRGCSSEMPYRFINDDSNQAER